MTDQPARPPLEPRPEKATFFVTCLVDQFRPQVGDAVVDILESEGITVDVPPEQTCCGQPAFNSGFRAEAREVASRFLDLFDRADEQTPIVAPSGSCAAMVRNYYPILFRDDPAELERANRVGDRLWELTEFLADGLGLPDKNTDRSESTETATSEDVPGQAATLPDPSQENAAVPPATYHRCCHALRELGIDRQPSQLLDAIPDLALTPLERSEVCCGFGGSFSVKMPDISTAMLEEKLDNVEATGASTLIAGDTGCIMHMEGGLRRRGSNIRVLHIAEALSEAAKRRSTPGSSTAPPTEPAPAAEEAHDPATDPARIAAEPSYQPVTESTAESADSPNSEDASR